VCNAPLCVVAIPVPQDYGTGVTDTACCHSLVNLGPKEPPPSRVAANNCDCVFTVLCIVLCAMRCCLCVIRLCLCLYLCVCVCGWGGRVWVCFRVDRRVLPFTFIIACTLSLSSIYTYIYRRKCELKPLFTSYLYFITIILHFYF